MRVLFLSPVHPLLTPGNPLPKWQMQMSWVRGLEKAGAEIKVVKYTPGDHIEVNLWERGLYNLKVVWGAWQFLSLRAQMKSGRGNLTLKLDRHILAERDLAMTFETSSAIIYSLGADVLFSQTIKLIKWLTKLPLIVLSGVSPISDGNLRERAMAKLVDLAAVNDEKQAGEWRKLGARKAVVLPISAIDPELHWPRFKDSEDVLSRVASRSQEMYPDWSESSSLSGRPIRHFVGQKSLDVTGGQFLRKKSSSSLNYSKRDIDVLFVGTLTLARKKFLDRLRKILPQSINLVVKEFIWEEEYAGLMSRAKIVLNPIRSEMAGGANLRMFEIPAFGALELASNGKKEWLTPGKEILVYRDAEEAAGLIVEYLKDGKKREDMAQRGKRRVEKKHTFVKRAEKLMEFIKV